MDSGLYIAATGMVAEQARQDQIATDLANASTPGYKPVEEAQTSFGDLLVSSATGRPLGAIGLGADLGRPQVDLAQGALQETDEPLDIALDGPGFLAVRTQAGTVYTRDGQLTADATGRLETATGGLVLGTNGNPIAIPPGAKPQIEADGTVKANGAAVGKLAVVSLANPQRLGDNDFTGTPGAAAVGTQVRQGYLESSGADAATSMIDMIVSMRSYQSSQQAIQAIDETLQKAISAGSATGS